MNKFLKGVLNIFMALVAFFASILLQGVLILPVMFYYMSSLKAMGKLENGAGFVELLKGITKLSDLAVWVTVAWGILGIFVFLLWYKRVTKEENKIRFFTGFSGYTVIGFVFITIGAQLFINYACEILEGVFSNVFSQYESLMDMSGLSTVGTIVMLVYGIFIAPIHEEILFRGVIMHYSKKAVPFVIANFIQALLFGIMHMNIVQSTYAFLVGLILGYVFEKSKNLTSTIVIHIMFNIMGSFPIIKTLPGNPLLGNIIVSVVGLMVLVVGIVFYNYYIKERGLIISGKRYD